MQKNPGVAAVLSFFFTGLGQIYNGQIGKGILFIILQIISIVLMFSGIGFITFPIIWIWGMVDAYKTAEKINASIASR
jgi:TM2 domain-containing membrane protein YozV